MVFRFEPERFKADRSRKSRPNIALFDPTLCKQLMKGWAQCLSEYYEFGLIYGRLGD